MLRTSESAAPSVLELLSWVQEDKVEFINVQFTDIMGVLKGVTIPMSELDDALREGLWFDGSSIEGFRAIAESDMFLVPDRTTYRVIPWEQDELKTARVVGDVFVPSGESFLGDPRAILRRQLERLKALGYGYNTGPELEFFLFRREGEAIAPLPQDRAGYFDISTDLAATLRKEIVVALSELGVTVEQAHHERAIGQHEIDFRYADALATADNATAVKYAIRAVAQRRGLHATFMPKPVEGVNGSGMHTHQSLYDLDSGDNAFVDPNDDYGLSQLARHFIAGQLHHARGMAAVLAPIGNSYRRLVPGYEAPVYVSWGRTNRSALIRVPAVRPNKVQATRVELRCPDSACNPYLAFAVMLAAGIDGIERELPVPSPVEENLYHFSDDDLKRRGVKTLPATLGEAIAELEADDVIRCALGEHAVARLIEAQRQDWDALRQHVGDWERGRYLEVF